MKITDIITGPVVFNNMRGGGLFVDDRIIAVTTTFAYALKACDKYEDAEKLQTEIGNWIAEAINEKLEREKNKP